jgi:hypothetical protein
MLWGGFVGTGVCFFNGFRGVGFEEQTNDGLVCLRGKPLMMSFKLSLSRISSLIMVFLTRS